MGESPPETEKPGTRSLARLVPWRTGLAVLLLTLLVWMLFWQAALPLDLPSTVVVALAATVLVALGQALWSRLHRAAKAPR